MSYLVKIIAYRRLASGTPLSSLCEQRSHRREDSQHTMHMQTVRRRVYVWREVLSSIKHTRNSVSAQCLTYCSQHTPEVNSYQIACQKEL